MTAQHVEHPEDTTEAVPALPVGYTDPNEQILSDEETLPVARPRIATDDRNPRWRVYRYGDGFVVHQSHESEKLRGWAFNSGVGLKWHWKYGEALATLRREVATDKFYAAARQRENAAWDALAAKRAA